MTPVAALDQITVWRTTASGRLVILDRVSWTIGAGERWALLGPNGAGKTTLLNVLAAVIHPSSGSAEVLGRRFGRTDMAALRASIGFVDPALARALSPRLPAREVVLTGARNTILSFPEQASEEDAERAVGLLDRLGCSDLVDRQFGHCSQGERKRILIARALMTSPRLLVLDEPTAGLDLPGREGVLAALDALAASHAELAIIVVTHHLEELPTTTTHGLLLSGGRVVAAGPVAEVLAAEPLSRCFAMPIELHRLGERYAAVANATPRTAHPHESPRRA